VRNTMVSSMQFCKRHEPTYLLSLIFLFVFCFCSLALAASSSLHVKMAELVPAENAYLLNADFEIAFGDEVEEALTKGVPLNFLVEFQIVSPSKYWFDDEISSTSTNITFSYHALSRQYLINRNNHQYSFTSLQEAKEELARIRNWQVVEKSLVKKGENYYAALRMRLDQSKLPKPIQVDALGSEDWTMVSERYRWSPQLPL
jgi:hypothetical protein